nr:type 1 glutamine amidotransferase domain-containing protein [Solimonas flava]
MNTRKRKADADAELDRELENTFPASDAPAWGGSAEESRRRAAAGPPRRKSSGARALEKGGLHGKTFAILAADGFEQSELMEPKRALLAAGAAVEIVAPHLGALRGWRRHEWGDEVQVDLDLQAASPSRYDGLVLPGGVLNADTLRTEPRAVSFVKDFFANGKPVAAICHAPWLLIEADAVDGRRLTSWPSLKTDLRNAGGEWVDEAVVVDGTLVTSRKPADLPAFNEAMTGLFAQHQRRAQARTVIAAGDVP